MNAAIWAAIKEVGFPIVAAVALGWFVLFKIPVLEKGAEAMSTHTVETQTQTVLMRAICRNTAKTELQAGFCDYGLPRWGNR